MTTKKAPPRNLVDVEKVRNTPCQIALEWGLLVQGSREIRYRFFDEESSGAIQLHDDGKFTDHKTPEEPHTGHLIDLVMLYLNHHIPTTDPRIYAQALEYIAARGDFYLDFIEHRKYARKIAQKPGKKQSPFSWGKEIADAIEQDKVPKAQREEAGRLFEALGIPWDQWSACMMCGREKDKETGEVTNEFGALCWPPGIVDYGQRVMTALEESDEGGFYEKFGGWTKEATEKAFKKSEYAGRYIVFDFDGSKTPIPGTKKYIQGPGPKIVDVLRLAHSLKRAGVPPAVVAISSFISTKDENPNEPERAKFHFYFKSTQKASSQAQYLGWWQIIADTIEGVLAENKEWADTPEEDKKELMIDKCTKQVSRLIRVAGYPKFKRKRPEANIIYEANPGAFVDFVEIEETKPKYVNLEDQVIAFTDKGVSVTHISWKQKSMGAMKHENLINHPSVVDLVEERVTAFSNDPENLDLWRGVEPTQKDVVDALGKRAMNETRKKVDVAVNCWPVEVVETMEGHDTGRSDDSKTFIRYRYKRRNDGAARYGLLPASAASDQSAATGAARDASDNGVVIKPGKGEHWAHALVEWSISGKDVPVAKVFNKCGWKIRRGRGTNEETEYSFVYGSNVIGSDSRSICDDFAGGIAGTAQEWKKQIRSLAISPVLVFSLGTAFAAPMVEPLGLDTGGFHVCGGSSSGKSLATYLAATLYYTKIACDSWHATGNALNQTLADKNSFLAIFDDIKKCDSPKSASKFILAATDGRNKSRMERSGSRNRKAVSSRSLFLSSGELTVMDYLQEHGMGGHDVRLASIWIDQGESTRSRQHADRVKDFYLKQFGTMGPLWIEHLVGLDDDAWDGIREEIRETSDRIIAWLEKEEGSNIEGEFIRVIDRIALVEVALKHAIQAGMAPEFITDMTLGTENDEGYPKNRNYRYMDEWEVSQWITKRIRRGRSENKTPYERAWNDLKTHIETEPGCYPMHKSIIDGKINGIRKDVPLPGITEEQCDKAGDALAFETGLTEFTIWTTPRRIKAITHSAGVNPKAFLQWACSKGYASPDSPIKRKIGSVDGRWYALYPSREPSDPQDKVRMDADALKYNKK